MCISRDEFIRRIAAAILAGQRKSGDPVDPASAAAYATHVDKLPGLFRAGIHKIAAEFGVGAGFGRAAQLWW